MGNGRRPAVIGLDPPDRIDDGTTARVLSPLPGPVGFDARSGTAARARASIAALVVRYARRNRGSRVGNGECFALVDEALRGAGAKTARDFGTLTADADYVWGTSVTLADLQPGDVIQFRDYSYERVVVTRDSSMTTTDELTVDRPHHTAIVESVHADGAVTVWEQNAPVGSAVARTELFFTSTSSTHGNRSTKITVHGSFWFYRPEAHD
jgi:CHAP domain-containing protein